LILELLPMPSPGAIEYWELHWVKRDLKVRSTSQAQQAGREQRANYQQHCHKYYHYVCISEAILIELLGLAILNAMCL
jgi:hypothetical protein